MDDEPPDRHRSFQITGAPPWWLVVLTIGVAVVLGTTVHVAFWVIALGVIAVLLLGTILTPR